MSVSKTSRAGGKIGIRHKTVLPYAATLVDLATAQTEVTKVCLGFISAGLRVIRGSRRVKITDEKTCILLLVRDVTACQEIRVYTRDRQVTKLAIARGARNNNIRISFRTLPE